MPSDKKLRTVRRKKSARQRCSKHGLNCYAIMLNNAGDGAEVYLVDRFCEKCGAHLSPRGDGICLNACHLSDESRTRFTALMSVLAAERGR